MNSGYENDSLIMVDKEMYSVKLENGRRNYLSIFAKDNKLIGMYCNPNTFIQVGDKDFLISYKQEEDKMKLEHLEYNEQKSILLSKYELVYDNSNDNNFLISKNVVIIRDREVTTIYNYKNGNVLTFENLKIIGTRKVNGNTYLVANIKVGNIEKLVMYIDVDNLEFEEFYSVLQDRYIKVIENENLDFRNRLGMTLEKQVYKYVEYIEEYEDKMASRQIGNVYKKLEKSNKKK